ncbi:MAG TPA: bifunctional hydroxymethylpyrimidine kinase/phosphomethylpyrimidine kinase [Gemmatimonadaceae bacterium]|nr:bifunctional hydroxymethylpyrimidine kinase/phosphomethylpyrimidine kinase [Gemmatimonadaceae bacterium]
MPSAERTHPPSAGIRPSPDVIALTIAGSDSGGGAGIQADLKTFHRFGVFGTSVLTAITAQNTVGVAGWTAVSTDMIRAQIDAVARDLRPAAVKSGMLADAAVVRTVADALRLHALAPYVLDPVMVATSGDPLLEADAVAAIASELFPLATLVTPNLDEVSLLLGEQVRDERAMRAAARALVDRLGAGAALVKGGHLAGEEMVDVLYVGAEDEVHVFRRPKIHTTSTHGTGCTLSSAVTALLARGVRLAEAVRQALDFVNRAIATAPGLGRGHGPLNFFA